MSLFAGKQKPLVGIDIGPSYIKVVELSRTLSRGVDSYRLDKFGLGPVPAGALEGHRVAKPGELGAALQDLLKRSGIKAKRAAVAVSGSSVITKTLSLPAGMSDRELEALVQLEADQYIPYSLDEVKIDFEVLGPTRGSAENVDILLAASHSANVEERVSVVRSAGVEPVVVDVEAFALQNACEQLTEDCAVNDGTAVAIVDVGAFTTSVIVIQGGQVVYTREQNIGGARLSEDIQHRYGLGPDQAEEAKHSGELPDDYTTTVLEPFVELLAQDIRGALQFYSAAGSGEDVSKLFVTGGGAVLPDLGTRVSEETGVPARLFNPLANMSLASQVRVDRLKEVAPSLAVACGLALRRFDA